MFKTALFIAAIILPSEGVLQLKREEMLSSGKLEDVEKSVVAFMGNWKGDDPKCPKCEDLNDDWLASTDIMATVGVDTFWVNCSMETEWCNSQKLTSNQLPVFRAYLRHLPIDTFEEEFTKITFLHWVDLQFSTSAASHLPMSHRVNFHFTNLKNHFTESTGSSDNTKFYFIISLVVLPPSFIILFVLFSLFQALIEYIRQPRRNRKQKLS